MPRKHYGSRPMYDHCQYGSCAKPTRGLYAKYCEEHGELLKGHPARSEEVVKRCVVCGRRLSDYNESGLCSRDYYRNGDRETEYEPVNPTWLEAYRHQTSLDGEGMVIVPKASVGPVPTGIPVYVPNRVDLAVESFAFESEKGEKA